MRAWRRRRGREKGMGQWQATSAMERVHNGGGMRNAERRMQSAECRMQALGGYKEKVHVVLRWREAGQQAAGGWERGWGAGSGALRRSEYRATDGEDDGRWMDRGWTDTVEWGMDATERVHTDLPGCLPCVSSPSTPRRRHQLAPFTQQPPAHLPPPLHVVPALPPSWHPETTAQK